MDKIIKVLIVDDSAIVRQTLKELFETDSEIEVVDTASDPYDAVNKLKQSKPDVISLDVEMPRMDGLTFLKKIMSQHPIPVVIISTLTEQGSATAIKALEIGAVEVIAKPKINTQQALLESRLKLCDVIKAAAASRVIRKPNRLINIEPKLSADAVLKRTAQRSMITTTDKIIAIGASTGGTEAIRTLLEGLPMDCPGVVIVQHMPEMFTKQFAMRLDEICAVSVKEAEDGDAILRGHVLIAPGNKHMMLKRSGARYYVQVKDGPLVNRHRPSVDVLFRSVASYAGNNSLGVILTGMGADGAKGLLEMKESGAPTVAQNEKSCIVFGMPKEAIALGAAQRVLSLEKITPYVLENIRPED